MSGLSKPAAVKMSTTSVGETALETNCRIAESSSSGDLSVSETVALTIPERIS